MFRASLYGHLYKVISVLAFSSDGQSLNPAEFYIFYHGITLFKFGCSYFWQSKMQIIFYFSRPDLLWLTNTLVKNVGLDLLEL